MGIQDQRETTVAANGEEERRTKIGRAMELFKQFRLNEQSSERLASSFRCILRTENLDQKLSCNFMVHCRDIGRARAFADAMGNALGVLQDSSVKAEIMSERQFLEDSGKAIEVMRKSRIFLLCDCLSAAEYSPEWTGSRTENLIRDRETAWHTFIDACKKTSNVCKIIAAPETVLRERFRKNEHIYFRVFRYHIYIEDMPADEILSAVLDDLRKNKISYSKRFETEITKYIKAVYPKADLREKEFADDLLERILLSFFGDSTEPGELTEKHIPYYKTNKSYEECMGAINELVGLEQVKETFREIPYMIHAESRVATPALHMAFVGNPGTGKTTVAQLAADLLYSMGVIQKNKVVTVSALDLIGRYVGETPKRTKEYCEKAYGGILFLDEAYLLSASDNGSTNAQIRQECIGTLIQEMENNRDRLLVIFAGYPKEMEYFLYNSNSGLGSRMYKVIQFEDYTDDELMRIFMDLCEKGNYKVSPEAREKVRLKLSTSRYSRDFGNARTVRNVFLEAEKEYRRTQNSQDRVIGVEHISLETSLRDYQTVKAEFDAMIGLESAKEEITKAIATCRFTKENNLQVPFSKHMLFLGNAGTGKSTVAQLFCQMLFSIGVSKSPNCVSIAAGDLLGRTNPVETLQKYCDRATGGVLFIDEAYVFQASARYCSACVSVLLDVMERERENITVILAGYEEEMQAFLDTNQGLKSRFPVLVRFDDYSSNQLTEIFLSLCKKYGFTVTGNGLKRFREVIDMERQEEHFGNARTVRNIFEQSYRMHAKNYMNAPSEKNRFVLDRDDIVSLSHEGSRHESSGFWGKLKR